MFNMDISNSSNTLILSNNFKESIIEPLRVNYTRSFHHCFFENLLLILREDFIIEITSQFIVKHWNHKRSIFFFYIILQLKCEHVL